MEQQSYRACERIQDINKTKSRHIQIDHTFYHTRSMVSLEDGLLSDVGVKKKISCQ